LLFIYISLSLRFGFSFYLHKYIAYFFPRCLSVYLYK
jgi:hypothetical protein